MKKVLLAATLVMAFNANFAKADVIKCSFTEPFFDTTYSMAEQSLTRNDSEGKKTVVKNVSFQIVAAGKFELRDKNGNVLQALNLSFNGSDGMSDNVYPYEVTIPGSQNQPNGGIGGCESNLLHIKASAN